MRPATAYFMRDQVGNRVREIMRHPPHPRPERPVLWPVAVVAAALTLANIMIVVPA